MYFIATGAKTILYGATSLFYKYFITTGAKNEHTFSSCNPRIGLYMVSPRIILYVHYSICILLQLGLKINTHFHRVIHA